MKDCGNSIPFGKISDDVKEYVSLKVADLKLGLVENFSSFVGKTLALILTIFLISASFTFFGAAAVIWIGGMIGSYAWAAVIMGGFFVLLGVIVYLCRNGVVSLVVPMFSKMFFPEPKQRRLYDDDEEDE